MKAHGDLIGKLHLGVRTSMVALASLRPALGVRALPGLVWEMRRRAAAGEPWQALGPAATERERICRDQARDAVLLFVALTSRVGEKRALALTGQVLRESAVLHLRRLLPRVDRAAYAAMEPAARKAMLEDLVGRFPNSTVDGVEASVGRFSYRITRCELVELMRRIGRPLLAPLFCKGDEDFFGRDMPEVVFERPSTLAEGGACCEFRFRWRQEGG